MNIVMTKTLQTQQKTFKEINPKYFFKVNIKAIREYQLLTTLSGSELKVLLAIASFLGKEKKVFPSQRYLSRLTGLSISTVSRIVTSLSSKRFMGEEILSIEKGREKGNKFTNNRYELSTKVGIRFGEDEYSGKFQNSVEHTDQAKKNSTNKESQLIKENITVSSFKKKEDSSNPESVQVPDLNTLRKDESFSFYAKAISKQKRFKGNLLYAERVFRKNIEVIGYENWLDLAKKLKYHPTPQDLLDHVRYKTSQEKMSYKEAMDDWDKQF